MAKSGCKLMVSSSWYRGGRDFLNDRYGDLVGTESSWYGIWLVRDQGLFNWHRSGSVHHFTQLLILNYGT